jgi:hypothetical protein
LVQDADDWSAPERVSKLLKRLLLDRSDFAFSAWQQYRQDGHSILRPASVRWRRADRGAQLRIHRASNSITKPEAFVFDCQLTVDFVNRASHHGLFKRSALDRIGGYYGGFKMNYDTLLTNLLLMTGKVSFVDEPLYHYVIRRDSLSHGASTGNNSQIRILTKRYQAAIYCTALHWYWAWMEERMTSSDFFQRVRNLVVRPITPQARAELRVETSRLAALIRH